MKLMEKEMPNLLRVHIADAQYLLLFHKPTATTPWYLRWLNTYCHVGIAKVLSNGNYFTYEPLLDCTQASETTIDKLVSDAIKHNVDIVPVRVLNVGSSRWLYLPQTCVTVVCRLLNIPTKFFTTPYGLYKSIMGVYVPYDGLSPTLLKQEENKNV